MKIIMIRIELDLSSGCIQTAIKKKYNRLLAACLAAEAEDGEIEEKVELLKYLLETAQFPRLRAQHPVLAGHHDADVWLSMDDGRQAVIVADNQKIDPGVGPIPPFDAAL